MAPLSRALRPAAWPRVPFINGFCYVIKRRVLDAVGYFDEESFAAATARRTTSRCAPRGRLRARDRRRRLRLPRQVAVLHARGAQPSRSATTRSSSGSTAPSRVNALVSELEHEHARRPSSAPASRARSRIPSARRRAAEGIGEPISARLRPARHRRRRLGRLALDLPGGRRDCERSACRPASRSLDRAARGLATTYACQDAFFAYLDDPRRVARDHRGRQRHRRHPLPVGAVRAELLRSAATTSCPPTTCRTTSRSSPKRFTRRA